MPLLVFLLLTAITAQGQVSVTTYRNDLARSGVNPEETILTPANVNPAGFGKRLLPYLSMGRCMRSRFMYPW